MSALISKKLLGKVGCLKKLSRASFVPSRKLNLLEYQSKELLKDCGVSVQNFMIVDDLNKAPAALDKFRKCCPFRNYLQNALDPTNVSIEFTVTDVDEYVIKAQVLAGGRGKGWFDNGFKGGVHLTKE